MKGHKPDGNAETAHVHPGRSSFSCYKNYVIWNRLIRLNNHSKNVPLRAKEGKFCIYIITLWKIKVIRALKEQSLYKRVK
jgi:hypothetical protein